MYLSLGGSNSGLDFDIDVSGLPYDFVTTGALRLVGDNVTRLPVTVENTQDYIKAADYCIAKAGWGTVAEIMIAGARAALLERKDTPEDTMIIEQLTEKGAAIAVAPEDLKDMRKVMEQLEHFQWRDRAEENQAEAIGKRLLSLEGV